MFYDVFLRHLFIYCYLCRVACLLVLFYGEIRVTQNLNVHFMHLLWIIKFFCICNIQFLLQGSVLFALRGRGGSEGGILITVIITIGPLPPLPLPLHPAACLRSLPPLHWRVMAIKTRVSSSSSLQSPLPPVLIPALPQRVLDHELEGIIGQYHQHQHHVSRFGPAVRR